MPSNAKKYAEFLRKQAVDLPERVYMPRFRTMAFKILELAAQNSPVNFGTLRNGWHVTVGSPSKTSRKASSLADVLATAQATINGTKFGDGIWIQNNESHARVYEFGLFEPKNPGPSDARHVPKSRRHTVEGTVLISGGFHVVAPHGMLADAVQQVEAAMGAGQL